MPFYNFSARIVPFLTLHHFTPALCQQPDNLMFRLFLYQFARWIHCLQDCFQLLQGFSVFPVLCSCCNIEPTAYLLTGQPVLVSHPEQAFGFCRESSKGSFCRVQCFCKACILFPVECKQFFDVFRCKAFRMCLQVCL